MTFTRFGFIVTVILLTALAAWARATFLDIPVKDALASPKAANKLEVPFYMAGEKHPKVVRTLGDFKSNQRTNAVNKSDRSACHIAFLSALISLQERAKREGGNAVIEIRSVTKNRDLTSATDYRCVAGDVVANVALSGTVVELAGKK